MKPAVASQSGHFPADPPLLHWFNGCKGGREIESHYNSAVTCSESSQTLLNDPRVSLWGPPELNDRFRNSQCRVKGWCLSLGLRPAEDSSSITHTHTHTYTDSHTPSPLFDHNYTLDFSCHFQLLFLFPCHFLSWNAKSCQNSDETGGEFIHLH